MFKLIKVISIVNAINAAKNGRLDKWAQNKLKWEAEKAIIKAILE